MLALEERLARVRQLLLRPGLRGHVLRQGHHRPGRCLHALHPELDHPLVGETPVASHGHGRRTVRQLLRFVQGDLRQVQVGRRPRRVAVADPSSRCAGQLVRNGYTYVLGTARQRELDVRVDGERVKLFTVGGDYKGVRPVADRFG